MSSISDDWIFTTYGEATQINAQSISESAVEKDRTIRYVDIASVVRPGVLGQPTPMRFRDAPSRARRVVRCGDTLVSCVRPHLKSFAFVSEPIDDLVASTGFAVISPTDRVLPEFLYQTVWSEEFATYLASRMTGSNYPAVTARDVAEAPLALPPLAEQKKIAAILSSVDEAIRANEAVIEQTRRVKEGLLQELLTRGIGHTEFRETELGPLPVGWRVMSLGSLLDEGPRNGVYKRADQIGEGVLVVGQTAITDERTVNFGATRRASSDPGELATFGLKDGDVLVTRVYATPEGCGRPAFVEVVPEPSLYESNLIRMRPNKSLVDPAYLFAWMMKASTRAYLMSRSSSSNQTSVNQSTLSSVIVGVPPYAEQRTIVECLSGVRDGHREGDAVVAALKRVKFGLLQDLLTGKVRVSA